MGSSSIGQYVGKKLTEEVKSKMSDAEIAAITLANTNLRRFGWGPYTAILSDSSGAEATLPFSGYAVHAVEGAAHIMVRVVRVCGIYRRTPNDLVAAMNDPVVGEKVSDALARLRNYHIMDGMSALGNCSDILRLDSNTIGFVMRNKRGQLIYRS